MPVYATAGGVCYPDNRDGIQSLLAAQPRRPVRFAQQIESAWQAGGRIFVEIGPKAALSGLIGQCLGARPHATVAVMPSAKTDSERQLREAVLRLRVLGVALEEPGPLPAPPKPQNWTKTAIAVSGALIGQTQRNVEAAALREEIKHAASSRGSTPAPQPGVAAPMRPASPLPEVAPGDEALGAHAEFLALAREQTSAIGSLIAQGDLPRADALIAQAGKIAELHRQWLDIDHDLAERPSRAAPLETPNASARSLAPPLPERPVAVSPPLSDVAPAVPLPREVSAPAAQQPAAAADVSEAVLTGWLIDIVATQTGYPPDFLAPDMEIEADLGVDSIKLVEIIAALREKLVAEFGPRFEEPDAIPREAMVRARNIADVAAVLHSSLGEEGAQDAALAAPGDPMPMPSGEGGPLEETLIAIVAEQTGYPADVLTPDLDIEADLGIDSIKRVEIFAALREAMPERDETAWPDKGALAQARSLSEIYALFEERKPGQALTETAPEPAPKPTETKAEPTAPAPLGEASGAEIKVLRALDVPHAFAQAKGPSKGPLLLFTRACSETEGRIEALE
ncbi:MAG: phosphopantetheine-binding protein, partial [Pseudomonadota bacterium]